MEVADAGCGVPDRVRGVAVATGVGWLWLNGAQGPVQVTGPAGLRGPLTVRCQADPRATVGEAVAFAVGVPRWRADPLPSRGPRGTRRRLAESLAPLTGRDPAMTAERDMSALIHDHGGRGTGLTPEGDDLLMGIVAGRLAVAAPGAAEDARLLGEWAAASAGEPSRSLLLHAARGELIEPAHDALAALVRADAAALAPAAARLVRWGASSGRALLAGLAGGVWGGPA